MFLNNFVIPIMYKNSCLVLEGWRRFLQLFRENAGSFLLYGLFLFLLHMVVIIFVVIAGIFTCCIGFILLIIPYINAVILLPISYTFRAYSVEFLEQFGRGIGYLLCGILLALTSTNYQITVMIVVLCIIPGVILWILAMKWFPVDRENIKTILAERAEILNSRKEF